MGAHRPCCSQARPSSVSGSQCRPWRTQGPGPPCPRTCPGGPGSPNSWAAWGPCWDSSGEGTALPSSPATPCHWLREGARGFFSGSCTSRPGGKDSTQAHALGGGLPAADLTHGALHSCPPSTPLTFSQLPHLIPAAPAAWPGLQNARSPRLPPPGVPFAGPVSTANSPLPVSAPTSPEHPNYNCTPPTHCSDPPHPALLLAQHTPTPAS